MVYFRFYYDPEYDDKDHKHPVIEIPYGTIHANDIERIVKELGEVILPSVLTECELRFMKK